LRDREIGETGEGYGRKVEVDRWVGKVQTGQGDMSYRYHENMNIPAVHIWFYF
jgi:hypothetical protein